VISKVEEVSLVKKCQGSHDTLLQLLLAERGHASGNARRRS